MAAKTGNPLVRVPAAITDARIRAASGRGAEAAQKLRAAFETARKSGIVSLELEARLALTQISKNRTETEAVGKEAAAKGFGWIARRAAQIQTTGQQR